MNIAKRTINPLRGNVFAYGQAENAVLIYQVNWGVAIQPLTVSTSEWTVDGGTVSLSSEALSGSTTSVMITGDIGDSIITNKVTLSDDQIDERTILLSIGDEKAQLLSVFGSGAGSSSNAILETIFDAKGDLIGASGEHTPLILTVGTEGQVLTVNGASATGLTWADAAVQVAHKDTHDPEDGADPLDTAEPGELAGVQASAEGTSHSLARADHGHQVQHSIANNHLVTIDDADAADNDYSKFTADGLEGRSYSEVRTDINVADGADVTGDNPPQAHKDLHDPEDGSDALDTDVGGNLDGVQAAATGTSHSVARADHGHRIQHSISDNAILTIDHASVVNNDYGKFTANGLEGRSYSEVRTDINVADGADVTGDNDPKAHKDLHDPEDGSDALDTAAPSELAGVQASAEGTSHSLARSDHDHQIQASIADNHLLTVDQADAADNDFAKFTASGLEGRSASETKGDLAIVGTDVELNEIGTATYDDVQDQVNTSWSAGLISGGTVTDGGGATVDVAALIGVIRSSDSDVAALYNFDFAGSSSHAITADSIRYVGIEYNAGTPQVVVKTAATWTENDDFQLATVVNEGGTLHISQLPQHAGDTAQKTQHRLVEVEGLVRADQVGGIILGETGTRYVTLSAGELYNCLTEYTIAAIDTTPAGDTFDLYYSDGGAGFTKVAAQTQWPNTQYDDGDGGLADLTNNRYGNIWFWVETNGALVAMYGTSNSVSSAGAEAEDPPSSVPNRTEAHGILVGRIIFQKSAATATQIDSAFTVTFDSTQASDHGNLSGLSDDDHPQYVLETLIDAKGDLLAGSADDTAAKLTVGANGEVLTANSAEATGLEWVAAGAPGAHKDTHDPEDGADALDTAAAGNMDGVQAGAEGTAHSFARSDHAHRIQHSIADNAIMTIDDADAADDDYAKFTADGLEGRSYTEARSDLNVEDGADVTDATNVAAAGAIMETLIAAKGDLIGASADDTPLVLTVGANDEILTADSGEASGLKWAAPGTPGAHKDIHDPEDGSDPLDTDVGGNLDGVQAAATGTSHSLSRADHAHRIQHSISDNAIATLDSASIADDEIARFTASGLESRSDAEMKTQLGYLTDLADDATPTLGGELEVGEVGIKIDEALSADGTYSGVVIDGVSGYATSAFGDLIYLNTTDQRWELTDADAEATAGDVMLGLALTAGADGVAIKILIYGFIREDDWNFTSYGQALYVSTTAGDMTQTAPSASADIVRVVGYAHDNADTIFFNPGRSWVEIT